MMYECCHIQGLLILYEFIVKPEIPTFCGCMCSPSILFYWTAQWWLLMWPNHAAVDIVYNICYADGLFVGLLTENTAGNEWLAVSFPKIIW